MIYKIEIIYNDVSKELSITGPVQDRILAYGMLGMAADLIQNISDQAGRSAKPATGLVLPMSPSQAVDLDRKLRGGK